MAMDIQGVLDMMGGGAMNIVIVLVLLACFAGGTWFGMSVWKKRKQYSQFKCVVWEKDAFGQLKETYDSAGIFVDTKTKNKRFFLKKGFVGLNPDNVPVVPTKKQDVVYLYRKGLKNYFFINPVINDKGISFDVGEEDVNWAVNAYERQKNIFGTDKWLQYMPFIALAFVSMVILIIFIYFFKDFAVLKEMAIALREAANAIAQAQSGTVVVPS